MKDFINYSDFLQKVSKPLFKCLPVRHFGYIEIHPNGDFYALSSDRDLFEEYLKRGYYQRTPMHVLLYNTSGIYLNDYYTYPKLPPNTDHNYLLADFDYGHTCLIMEQEFSHSGPISKFYTFEGLIKDTQINHLYVNNLDIIKKFTKYFDLQFADIKHNLIPERIPIQLEMDFYSLLGEEMDESTTIVSARNHFLSLLSGAARSGPKPTSREIEVIQWNLKGKTAEETAAIMHISRRTVEKHFEKLKKKFGCYSKSQVALQMAKLLDF